MYIDYIRLAGKQLIENYLKSGHVATGINGPYDDPETEVRNLAHLVVITAIECISYNIIEYRNIVARMADELLSMVSTDGTYKMRQKTGKDQCNGVIGHAWLNEGLLYAYKVTGNKKYIDEAVRICRIHDFQPKLGLWGRPLMGNNDSAIDYTFNHQLWFAASLAEVLTVVDDIDLKKQLYRFLSCLKQNLKLKSNGRIAHSIYSRIRRKEALKMRIKMAIEFLKESIGRPSLRYKEVGYHVFNLMAFARLYNAYPGYVFFNSKSFNKICSYLNDTNFQMELETANLQMDGSSHGNSLTDEEKSLNIYGYPYNVVGFEIAYCKKILGNKINSQTAEKLISKQFELTWDNDIKCFGNLCHDKHTVNYRIYEYYRYIELFTNENH